MFILDFILIELLNKLVFIKNIIFFVIIYNCMLFFLFSFTAWVKVFVWMSIVELSRRVHPFSYQINTTQKVPLLFSHSAECYFFNFSILFLSFFIVNICFIFNYASFIVDECLTSYLNVLLQILHKRSLATDWIRDYWKCKVIFVN